MPDRAGASPGPKIVAGAFGRGRAAGHAAVCIRLMQRNTL